MEQNDAPDPAGYNAAGVEAISKNRDVVHQEPCLLVLPREASEPAPASQAEVGRKRRDTLRGLFQELSRYYPLDGKKPYWMCPGLLAKCKHGRFKYAGDIQLTPLFTSGERFGGPPRTLTSELLNAWSVDTDGDGRV